MCKSEIKGIIKLLNGIPGVRKWGKAYLWEDEHQSIVIDELLPRSGNFYDLFDECSDETAETLLRFFIKNEHLLEFELACNFARLLALRGRLVYDEAEAVIRRSNWGSFASPQLMLSFIVNLPDFAQVLDSLLGIVHEDFRDGLFIACMDSEDPEILGILHKHFMTWVKEGDGFEDGTGELGWLHDFLGKFINHFPTEKLLPLMEHYFKNV